MATSTGTRTTRKPQTAQTPAQKRLACQRAKKAHAEAQRKYAAANKQKQADAVKKAKAKQTPAQKKAAADRAGSQNGQPGRPKTPC